MAGDEEYGAEGLADVNVVAQLTDQSTAHEKGLDEVLNGDVDIARHSEIGKDELLAAKRTKQLSKATLDNRMRPGLVYSECMAKADSVGWICSRNEEEQNSGSAVVHVYT